MRNVSSVVLVVLALGVTTSTAQACWWKRSHCRSANAGYAVMAPAPSQAPTAALPALPAPTQTQVDAAHVGETRAANTYPIKVCFYEENLKYVRSQIYNGENTAKQAISAGSPVVANGVPWTSTLTVRSIDDAAHRCRTRGYAVALGFQAEILCCSASQAAFATSSAVLSVRNRRSPPGHAIAVMCGVRLCRPTDPGPLADYDDAPPSPDNLPLPARPVRMRGG